MAKRADIVLSLDSERTSCLWRDGAELYVGTEWHDEGDDNHLFVLDRATYAVRKTWTMPFLVSDVVVVGDTCFASLGPGELAQLASRGLGDDDPEITSVDANAVSFAVHGDALFWGTFWGEVHCRDRGLIASVRKSLQSIAIDGEHVYVGYDDGKLRTFRRDDGKRVKVLGVGKRKAECAFGDKLFTANDSGRITRWSPTFTAEVSFDHDVGDSEYGVVGLDVFDNWLVSVTSEQLRVYDHDGGLAVTWSPEGDDSINDAWLDDGVLLVATGSKVVRLDGLGLR